MSFVGAKSKRDPESLNRWRDGPIHIFHLGRFSKCLREVFHNPNDWFNSKKLTKVVWVDVLVGEIVPSSVFTMQLQVLKF